jgi:hypothetical protein
MKFVAYAARDVRGTNSITRGDNNIILNNNISLDLVDRECVRAIELWKRARESPTQKKATQEGVPVIGVRRASLTPLVDPAEGPMSKARRWAGVE